MTTLDKTVDAIGRIAAEFPRLYREAASQYGVEVEAIVRSGSRDAARIERTLDGLLGRPKIALFCSVKCPGKLILETYDLAKRFRDMQLFLRVLVISSGSGHLDV